MNPDVTKMVEALESGEELAATAQAIMDHIAPATHGYFDIGVNKVLAIRKGWNYTRDPHDYFLILPELS